MNILSQSTDFAKACVANMNDATFPALIPTVTEPVASSTRGVIEWKLPGGGESQNTLMLIPFGTAADNDVFALRVTGWRRVTSPTGASALWIPARLLEVTCTLSTAVGVDISALGSTQRFADTLVAVGTPPSATEIFSPADNSPGWILLDAMGFNKIEISVDMAGGTTGGNALYAGL